MQRTSGLHSRHYSSAIGITALLLLSLFCPVSAKMSINASPEAQTDNTLRAAGAGTGVTSSSFVRGFEARLRPFFESKRAGARALRTLPPAQFPGETDLLRLTSLWSSLSPEFKALYKQATQIPNNYSMYVSPGGHFEVYYCALSSDTSSGVAAADTMGYGGSFDWRTKTNGPNGIPDYVDEVAFALDSSRSMMVDRFNFAPPLPNKDSAHTSDRYRLVITYIGSYYGVTYPDGKVVAADKGYSSHIELRNNWNGSEWSAKQYDVHPANGIRVTCAHELFHGVQYAMTWNLPEISSLDDFPLSWIEGSAVLMEELGFDYINDYLQYTTLFFNNPQMSFLDQSGSNSVYTNGLLAKYLFEKSTGTPRIDFIRDIFFTNYAQVTPFHENLRATSIASTGSPWAIVLNRFHTASYYSGMRADTSRFCADAGLMGQWNYSRADFADSAAVTKTINPYGMQPFVFVSDTGDFDTLSVSITATQSPDTLPYPRWGASCIIRGPAMRDSLLSLSIDTLGRATCRITGWKSRNELLVILSNGHPSDARNATVTLTFPAATGNSVTIFPNPGRVRDSRAGKFMRFQGNSIEEVRLYTMSGALVASSRDKAFRRYRNGSRSGFEWGFVNSHNATVAPGYYAALVTTANAISGGKKSALHKVLVFP
jgi:hypothetical protein